MTKKIINFKRARIETIAARTEKQLGITKSDVLAMTPAQVTFKIHCLVLEGDKKSALGVYLMFTASNKRNQTKMTLWGYAIECKDFDRDVLIERERSDLARI